MDAIEALLTRRSVRKFRKDPVPREMLTRIADAGRLAPTARNVQPWEFVFVTDAARRRQLAETSDYGKFIAEAPVCIVVLSKDTKYYLEDGSAATTSMLLAAHALGLGACWVAGDKKPYAHRIVSICGAPPDMKLVAMIALGYPAEVSSADKRSVDDVLHWDRFGNRT